MYGMRGEFLDSTSCSPECAERVRLKRREQERKVRELAAQKLRREAKKREEEERRRKQQAEELEQQVRFERQNLNVQR